MPEDSGGEGKDANAANERPKSVFPASSIQRQFWLIDRVSAENSAYNMPSVFQIKGLLDGERLEQSLSLVMERHAVFRTSLVERNGGLQQIVKADRKFEIKTTHFSELAENKREEALESALKEEIARPFELSKGPLIRARLFILHEDFHVFVVTMHHAIVDLRTKELFGIELSASYNSLAMEESTHPPEPQEQYFDYAIWQREWLKGERYEKTLSYWRKSLEGRTGHLDFPADRPHPAANTCLKTWPFKVREPRHSNPE